jgi:ATP-dependent helicase YprA (DUF1998 family)
MNVFELRNRLIADYANFVQSFFHIRDERIRTKVEEELREGLLWPEPLIQLNPSFEPGAWIDELVGNDILHDACRQIFRKEKHAAAPAGPGKPLRLHKHQTDAIKIAREGHPYILTTGTGSGKSLAYIIPIVDHVLRHGSGRGVQAIIVYPMNALANSQEGELEKFLCHGYANGKGPVTFARYTGQETDEQKQHIIANPPDILLTNYVMLELLLTRPQEKPLINATKHLHFLVLDELHTYRGRQGADVAMLVRRTREAFAAEHLQCVGTSATLAGAQAFFRRVKAGEDPGYPRFRGKGRYDSMTFPQYGNGCQMTDAGLKLSKIGKIRIKAHRPLEGTPKICTIRRSSTGKLCLDRDHNAALNIVRLGRQSLTPV